MYYPVTSDFVCPLGRLTRRGAFRYKAQPKYVDEGKSLDMPLSWHYGRVRFFIEELQAGRSLDPIEIDNECCGNHIFPIPTVTDGNHRLVAANLFGTATIQATYGGRIDLLNYLTGRRKTAPAE